MEDTHVMQSLEAMAHAVNISPYIILSNVCSILLALRDKLKQISAVSMLGHNAEASSLVIEKCLFVCNNLFMSYRGQ